MYFGWLLIIIVAYCLPLAKYQHDQPTDSRDFSNFKKIVDLVEKTFYSLIMIAIPYH